MQLRQLFSVFTLITSLVFISAPSFASGGGGYGGGGGSFQTRPVQRQVDRIYEHGKAIYSGRIRSVGKINYCVVKGEEKVKLKKRSIKPYKKATYTELASNLFNCDMPEELIATKLGPQNTRYVLYYLNKRFKLGLTS